MSQWKRRLMPFVRPAVQGWARWRRGLTLGVRGVVTDTEGRVLLIEHTYTPGWYLPGGGVERGETLETALARELLEEAGVVMDARPKLLSSHDNGKGFPGDHVLIYRIGAWRAVEATQRGEILNRGWFAPDALPEDTTPATRRRIAEVFGGAEPDPLW